MKYSIFILIQLYPLGNIEYIKTYKLIFNK